MGGEDDDLLASAANHHQAISEFISLVMLTLIQDYFDLLKVISKERPAFLVFNIICPLSVKYFLSSRLLVSQ